MAEENASRRKSVTIKEEAAVHEELNVETRRDAVPMEGELEGTLKALSPSSELQPPSRSALKRTDDIQFVIQSSDPIGQDTAVYSFNQYQMPLDEIGDARAALRNSFDAFERAMARVVAKSSILLGRSSGRDKVAGTIQYACMFWQWQPFVNLSGIKDGPEAPWQKLEESMSSARKVFRLGKWIKEYEKARFALTAPDAMLNLSRSRLQALVTRVLAVSMNTFSCLYYIYDNIIWAAQTNIINRVPVEGTDELRQLLSSSSTYEKYVALQARHKEAVKLQAAANARVERWKDMKNYSSLARLILAMIHSLLQVRCLIIEKRRLISCYKTRISVARGEEQPSSPQPSRPHTLDRYDSVGSNIARYTRKDVRTLEAERQERVYEIDDAVYEQHQELVACAGNLGILLNRLQFPLFKRMPLWVVGMLGVVSNFIGCLKNWPKYAPKTKEEGTMAKFRSESYDEQADSVASSDSSQK